MLKINAYYSLLLAIALFSNNYPLLSSQNDLKRTCNGLAIYYKHMNRNDYYDDNGIGLFTKWFNQEEMEIDEMEEELQDDNAADCGYLDFDDHFPLKKKIDDENEKQTEIFKIIQKCYRHGHPDSPYVNQSEADKAPSITSIISGYLGDNIEVLNQLIEKGVCLKEQYVEMKNALHYACWKGHLKVVKFLLDECGFHLEVRDRSVHQYTPFLYAASGGHVKVLEELRKRGANMKVQSKFKCHALHLACTKGRTKAVIWLLNNCKLDLEAKCTSSYTPFLAAVEPGHIEVLEVLKEKKVNMKGRAKWNRNALELAYHEGIPKTFKWVLDNCGFDVEGPDGEILFFRAVEEGKLKKAKLLKEQGVNINAKSEDGNNALHLACFSDDVDMVRWLLDECKIEIESKGYAQKTPFLCAAEGRSVEIAKLLKQRGANIHAIDENGDNALDLVNVYLKYKEMIKLKDKKMIKYLENLGLKCTKKK